MFLKCELRLARLRMRLSFCSISQPLKHQEEVLCFPNQNITILWSLDAFPKIISTEERFREEKPEDRFFGSAITWLNLLGVSWKPQDLLLMMGKNIFKINAS